jgi:hypothetical protein
VLAGHRNTHGEPLRNMPDLQPGDRVVVETRTTVFLVGLLLTLGGVRLLRRRRS